jgi:hypothetical protein
VCRHAVHLGTPVPMQLQIRKRYKRSQPQRGKLVSIKIISYINKSSDYRKLIFSGYGISDPEIEQPLQPPVVNSLTLGIAKSDLQVVRSV